MSDPPQVHGILFAHGLMAGGMVDAVHAISGCGEDALVALSNQEGGPEVLRLRLAALAKPGPCIVFTDLKASSCSTLALVALREGAVQAVVQGVNLAMLLDFVFHRELPLAELVPRLVEVGRGAVDSISARQA